MGRIATSRSSSRARPCPCRAGAGCRSVAVRSRADGGVVQQAIHQRTGAYCRPRDARRARQALSMTSRFIVFVAPRPASIGSAAACFLATPRLVASTTIGLSGIADPRARLGPSCCPSTADISRKYPGPSGATANSPGTWPASAWSNRLPVEFIGDGRFESGRVHQHVYARGAGITRGTVYSPAVSGRRTSDENRTVSADKTSRIRRSMRHHALASAHCDAARR